jgi:inhibitor of cysteine peptidase
MFKRSTVVIILFICLISMIPSFSFAETIKEYTEANTIIEVTAGETFIIALLSNRTTGFAWELVEGLDKSILQLVNSEYIVNDSKLIGAGGKEKLAFKALKPGKTVISLNYVRAWEKNAAPERKVAFPITVK